jgi:hypothetical protein
MPECDSVLGGDTSVQEVPAPSTLVRRTASARHPSLCWGTWGSIFLAKLLRNAQRHVSKSVKFAGDSFTPEERLVREPGCHHHLSKRSCFRQRMPLCFAVPFGQHACVQWVESCRAGFLAIPCAQSRLSDPNAVAVE